jgi:GntR family transcriptional regulator
MTIIDPEAIIVTDATQPDRDLPFDREAFERRRRDSRGDQQHVTSVRQAYELLRAGIFDGIYAENHKFDEGQTMRDLAATRAAIRGALGMLAAEGLVVRRQRFGTTVARGVIPIPIHQFLSRTEHNALLKDVQYLDVSHRRVSAPELVRRGLGIEDAEVACSERIIVVAGEAVELRVSYFPTWDDPLRPYPSRTHFAEMAPFEQRFEESFGEPFSRSHVTVAAVIGEARTCELLKLPEGTPLLMRTMRLLDATERVREVCFSYHRSDRVVFVA